MAPCRPTHSPGGLQLAPLAFTFSGSYDLAARAAPPEDSGARVADARLNRSRQAAHRLFHAFD